MKVYPKNSFDRFGDDLTELILQYLTFEDKVRLDCVSKQWRRLVFNKQLAIEINWTHSKDSLKRLIKSNENSKPSLDGQALKLILKKCKNIKTFDYSRLRLNGKVLSLIGRYCPNIKSLRYWPKIGSDDNILSFFRIYGHKLEELYLYGNYIINEIQYYFEFCPNLKKVSVMDFSVISSEDKEFMPKLERIESFVRIRPMIIDDITIDYVNKMKILSDKYSKTMKSLDIRLSDLTEEELKTCIKCIARFENLKELKLSIYTEEPIVDCLSLIGQKCNKLLKLDLSISDNVPISDNFFALFSKFKSIKKLTIYLPLNTVLSESVECFKHCKLEELDITYFKIAEDFFANIASFVPKLQLLRIRSEKQFSDSFINCIQSMKNMKSVYHVIGKQKFFENIWYFGRCLSKVMLSPNGMNVKPINDNCGLITNTRISG